MKLYNAISNPPEIPKLKQLTNPATGKRIYVTPSGNKFPSVTTVLQEYGKESLDAWRKKVGKDRASYIATTAAARGTRLHSLCEKYLQNEDPFSNPKISLFDKELFRSIKPALEDIDNIHLQEQRLYSEHLRLAGTVDCIAEHNGRLSVIDFKTSSKRKQKQYIENYFMQCSAYAVMYEELTGIPVTKIVIIIACENDPVQVFVEKRNNYINQLIYYRDLYEKNNPGYLDDVLDGYVCTDT
jgi:genome maintenance exonuclease 1